MFNPQSHSQPSHWQVVAASVTGKSHEKQDLPCQDAYAFRSLPNDNLIVAVADGAGSAKFSDLGARLAVETSVETLTQTLTQRTAADLETIWKDQLTQALQAAQTSVEQAAQNQNAELRDLATTLSITLITPEAAMVAQIGDGAVVVATPADEVQALTVPDRGEHLNETTFLVCENALETAQFAQWLGRPSHLAAFSDGLQLLALKLPQGIPHKPFFSPLFQFASQASDLRVAQEQLVDFLRSPRVTERTDDDLTLVLAALKL
ncbi:MAG: PP2C family serine/threonine-protein phosphatase [Microcoleaceae cyanobacterium]